MQDKLEKGEFDFVFLVGGGPTLFTSGGNRIVYFLANYIANQGYSVAVTFTGSDKRLLNAYFKDETLLAKPSFQLKKWFFSKFNNKFGYRYLLPMYRRLMRVDYSEHLKNVTLFFGAKKLHNLKINNLVATSWDTAFRAKYEVNARKKLFFSQVDEANVSFSGKYSNVARMGYNLGLEMIFINNDQMRKYGKSNSHLIRVGIDLNQFKLKIKPGNRNPCSIVSPLRRNNYKGADLLIEVAKKLEELSPCTVLKTFGDHEAVNLPSLISHQGLVPENELVNMYNDASIFVLPSRIEGTPLTALEAMACGCAVVSFDNIGINRCVQNLTNGIIVSAHDTSELAKAVVNLQKDDALRIKLATNAKDTSNSFSLENMGREFLKAII